MVKITITLEDDILRFVDQYANGNRSTYIKAVLAERRQQMLKSEIIAALQKDAANPQYQAEMAVWDSVAGDGI